MLRIGTPRTAIKIFIYIICTAYPKRGLGAIPGRTSVHATGGGQTVENAATSAMVTASGRLRNLGGSASEYSAKREVV